MLDTNSEKDGDEKVEDEEEKKDEKDAAAAGPRSPSDPPPTRGQKLSNLTFATLYVTENTKVPTMEAVLVKTPMKILAIICQSAECEVAQALAEWSQGFCSTAFQQQDADHNSLNKRDLMCVTRRVFLAMSPGRVKKLSLIHI